MRLAIKLKYLCYVILIIGISNCGGPLRQQVRPTPDNIEKVKKLAIIIPAEPDLTVIDEQWKSGGISTAFLCLPLAAAITQNQKSLDSKKAKLITSRLAEFSCRSNFIESLYKTLNCSGRFMEVKVFNKPLTSKDTYQYDAVVTFCIQNWGLRKVDRYSEKMAAFVELEVKMIQTRDKRMLWHEHDVALGRGRHPFESYQKDSELLQNDLKETIEEAGSRMANMLIYP